MAAYDPDLVDLLACQQRPKHMSDQRRALKRNEGLQRHPGSFGQRVLAPGAFAGEDQGGGAHAAASNTWPASTPWRRMLWARMVWTSAR
jgi:hypothetical protein